MSTNTAATTETVADAMTTFLTPEALLEHWQGHRRLTRRTVEAFPEEKLFWFTPEATMRPFGAMVLEIVMMVEPTLQGLRSGEWQMPDWSERQKQPAPSKGELLELWDKTSDLINEQWPRISEERFHEVEAAFGLPPQPNRNLILYLVDNEVHHRGQGFVYLRLLGVEPPAFWER